MSSISCLVMENKYDKIAPGPWRAILKLDGRSVPITEEVDPSETTIEEVIQGELPFVLEVVYDENNDFYINIINGEEKIKLDNIKFGKDLQTMKDTVLIDIPIYESYIQAICEERIMEGKWVVKTRDNYEIPFVARQGQNHRFTRLRKKPITDVSGKWEVTFGLNEQEPYPAIGEFKQDGNHLTGTFLTETGDYRFLEGTVQDNKLYLSCFDGAHAFLFEAKITDENTMIGSFRSGKHYTNTWEAKRNPDANLIHPDSLTFLKEGFDKVEFAFTNPQGKSVSLADEAYQNKIKIVQIFGTWCPNCRDETLFLTEYLKKKNNPDLAVIALAFEKHRDKTKANNAIQTYKEKFGIDYEMLHAGYANKKEAAQSLPMLNHILSYPTMIFIDRKNQVRKIHTGFAGPATSEFVDFSKNFDDFVSKLLEE